jgi:hypothetical protein
MRPVKFPRFLIFFISCAAYAQLPLGFGVKGGFSLTDAYGRCCNTQPSSTYSNAKDYIVGPFVELRLVKGLSVEADGLFRPVNLVNSSQITNIFTVSHYTTWEFPLLAKVRLGSFPIVKPLIEAGPSFRAHTNSAPDITADGLTVGGGVELKVPLIHLSSELRYTKWKSPGSAASTSPNVNQVELLFGISF